MELRSMSWRNGLEKIVYTKNRKYEEDDLVKNKKST